jgi:hypothetical protein
VLVVLMVVLRVLLGSVLVVLLRLLGLIWVAPR